MKVTVTRVLDPMTAGEFDQPDSGKRFVGVRLLMRNVGQGTYDDSPSNGAALITNRDEQADPTITTGGQCELQAGIKIAPGAKRRLCIPFEVPRRQRVRTFQLTLDSGFANQTGEWRLR